MALAETLPGLAAALECGGVGWQHCVNVAREVEGLSAEQCGQVERAILTDRRRVTAYQFGLRAKALAAEMVPAAEPPQEPTRSLRASNAGDGGVEIAVSLTTDGGRTVAAAVDAFAGRTGADDDRPVDVRRADALVEVCERALAGATGRGSAIHVTLHAGLDQLHRREQPAGAGPGAAPGAGPGADPGTGQGAAAGVEPTATASPAGSPGQSSRAGTVRLRGPLLGDAEVSVDAARRICCDTVISSAVHSPDGGLVGLGAEQRFPTAALRRRLEARDQHCRFPGCARDATRCHAHHVIHWADGGPTTESNCLLLCPRHHHAVHDGRWGLTFDGVTAAWTDPHGRGYDTPPAEQRPPDDPGELPFFAPYRPPPPARLTADYAVNPRPHRPAPGVPRRAHPPTPTNRRSEPPTALR